MSFATSIAVWFNEWLGRGSKVDKLAAWQSLFRLGAYGRQTKDVVLEVDIDYPNDVLIVKGTNEALHRQLGFAITRAQIDDNTAIDCFLQGVPRLIMLLEFDEEKYQRECTGLVHAKDYDAMLHNTPGRLSH